MSPADHHEPTPFFRMGTLADPAGSRFSVNSALWELTDALAVPENRLERLVYELHLLLEKLRTMLGAHFRSVPALAESRHEALRRLVADDGPLSSQTELVTFDSVHLATDADLDILLCLNGKGGDKHSLRWKGDRCHFVLGAYSFFVGSRSAGGEENEVVVAVAQVVRDCVRDFVTDHSSLAIEKTTSSYVLTWRNDEGRPCEFGFVPSLVDEMGRYWVLPNPDAPPERRRMDGMNIDMMRRTTGPFVEKKKGLDNVIRALKLMTRQVFPKL